MTTVSATFKDRLSAETAFVELEQMGISENQLSLIMTDDVRGQYYIEESSKVDEGAAAGAGIGGLIGAIAGTVAAAGLIVVPGLNLIVTGALMSSLAGLGAGALSGGLIGGLIGAGIPENEAKLYEDEVRSGNILLVVDALTDEEAVEVRRVLADQNGQQVAA